MSIRPGPQPQHENINQHEREAFRALLGDGAWTPDEAYKVLGKARTVTLIKEDYLGLTHTSMGYLILLMARGRVAACGTADKPRSFARCMDMAYQRFALQRLGWQVITDPRQQPETARDDLIPVRTPERVVMLTAQFGAGRGCSVEKMQNLVADWRSEALSRGLQVVVLTPNTRRGRKIQEREQAWLQLVHCEPLKQEGGRVLYSDDSDPCGSEFPIAVITGTSLPDLTVEILSLPREERIQRARQALATDTVISSQQLQRHYGLKLGDMLGVPYVPALLHPVHGRYGLEVKTLFLLNSKRMQNMHVHRLAHAAGLAEMRQHLGVAPEPDLWHREPRSHLSYEQPDAIWHSSNGDVAVEYDTGSYSTNTIQKKRGTFTDRGFAATIWGVPSVKRQQRLQQQFGQQVLLADWFNDGSA